MLTFPGPNLLEWSKGILGQNQKFKIYRPTADYKKPIFSAFCTVFHDFSFIYQIASVKQFTKIVGQCVLYVCTEGSIRKITIIITLSNKRLESHWVLTSVNSPLAAEKLHRVKTCFLGTTPLGPDNLLHMCYTVIFSNNNKLVNESKVFFPEANKKPLLECFPRVILLESTVLLLNKIQR